MPKPVMLAQNPLTLPSVNNLYQPTIDIDIPTVNINTNLMDGINLDQNVPMNIPNAINTKIDAIVQKAQTSIEDMDLSDEATTSAQATISAYAESIKANQDGAVKAANEVAAAVTRALESAHPTITVNVKQVGGTGGGVQRRCCGLRQLADK